MAAICSALLLLVDVAAAQAVHYLTQTHHQCCEVLSHCLLISLALSGCKDHPSVIRPVAVAAAANRRCIKHSTGQP